MNITISKPNTTSKRSSKIAIASISLGMLSFILQMIELIDLFAVNLYNDFWFHLISLLEIELLIVMSLSALLAILFGIIALVKIRNSNNLTGRGMAIAGIIFGSEYFILSILILTIEIIFFN
jgi:hypothetical protein